MACDYTLEHTINYSFSYQCIENQKVISAAALYTLTLVLYFWLGYDKGPISFIRQNLL
jgi:hypothetical protein